MACEFTANVIATGFENEDQTLIFRTQIIEWTSTSYASGNLFKDENERIGVAMTLSCNGVKCIKLKLKAMGILDKIQSNGKCHKESN